MKWSPGLPPGDGRSRVWLCENQGFLPLFCSGTEVSIVCSLHSSADRSHVQHRGQFSVREGVMEKYALAVGLPRRVPEEEEPASTDSELAERLALPWVETSWLPLQTSGRVWWTPRFCPAFTDLPKNSVSKPIFKTPGKVRQARATLLSYFLYINKEI